MANPRLSRNTRLATITGQAVGTTVANPIGLPTGIAGEIPNFVLTATEVTDGSNLTVTVEESADGVNWLTAPYVSFAAITASAVALPSAIPTRMPLPYLRVRSIVGAGVGVWNVTVDADTRRIA